MQLITNFSSSSSELQFLVDKVKRESLSSSSSNTQNLFLSTSPYDTAWLALIPHPHHHHHHGRPMFEKCLQWILHNQTPQGFWAAAGDNISDTDDDVTLDCLLSTLACLVALKRWQLAPDMIHKGLEFVNRNTERLVMKQKPSDVPRWFTIMFPAMLELAGASSLRVDFSENLNRILVELSQNRDDILTREEVDEKKQYSPLLLFLEALPAQSYDNDVLKQIIDKNLSNDGSLLQSPSATARAYMITGNTRCLSYLHSLTNSCSNGGVPSFYPVDDDLHDLVMVNQLTRSGLTEHLIPEIDHLLLKVQKNYKYKKASPKSLYSIAAELYRDSLAFWLLRVNNHWVSPSIFCWFLDDDEIRDHIETNYEEFAAVLLNVYRATDLMFSGEVQLVEARSFATKNLEKILATGNIHKTNADISSSLHKMIEHELRVPWTARMDHVENRIWIEEIASSALWFGKSSYLRLSCFHKMSLQQLAVKNYTLRQLVYRDELAEVERWSKERGLCDMGFCREKTGYCYYAFAASTCLPWSSDVRLVLTKAAVVITVADDFFDVEGSMVDLEKLTDAVRRWDAEGLGSHSKTIFEALDDLVNEVRLKCFQQNGQDIKNNLQQLWYETFHSWLMEAKWGKGLTSKPSVDVYLGNAMTSIAAHTMVLTASCLLGPGFPVHQLWSQRRHQDITSLLMVLTRLLNDIQSYLKEEDEGKINYVWMYMIENNQASIDDSVRHVQTIINVKKQEFIQRVLSDQHCNLPKSFKQLHFSCLKVFNMFFNSSNIFDTDTDLLLDIHEAFVSPPQVPKFKPHIKPPHQLPATLQPPHQPQQIMVNKKKVEMVYKSYHHPFKVFTLQKKQSSGHGTMNPRASILAGPNIKLCFS
uniref:S-linalool synthase n=1 Tax=Clarkia breweri TaxID=36903 RepID=LIS_CLABR|nr:RecName: Full=S-linalool synthase [Clarkia breweri]AAC49395.1 S-linalool synthase [Clarkia breweri]